MTQEILDPTIDLRDWVPARRRRLLLVAYVDLLLFSVPWGLFLFAYEAAFPQISDLPPVTKWLVFAIVEMLLLRLRKGSPGTQLLGIRFIPVRDHASPIDRLWQGSVPYVSRQLEQRESWYTLVLATLTLNEGCKSLIRWTMWSPPIPFFGEPMGEIASVAIYLISGAIQVGISVCLYRVDIRAVFVGVPYGLVQLASAITSWALWDDWVAEMISRRRAYQGLAVREGEIERMQSVTPEILVAALAAGVILLLIAAPRLLRAAKTQA